VVVSPAAPADRVEALRVAGCEMVTPSPEYDGTPKLPQLLDDLGRRRWTNILVEGGSEVLGRFLDSGAIDEVHVFISPCLLGGQQGKTPIAGRGYDHIADAWRLGHQKIEMIDGDFYVNAWK
jgi:diaminohydroxyphosphoribosylaminopyrimidine deaminase / 5-amino-6-(5-phosphoribosylamino)uracil reductase